LERTLESFFAFNTYPIAKTIIIEDGPGNYPKFPVPDLTYLSNGERIGQVKSIDRAYSYVKTPYLWHSEDDWSYHKQGFVEASRDILERYPSIIQVRVQAHDDTNGHPIEQLPEFPFPTMVYNYLDQWHGFAWNPGLRRLKDYQRLGTYTEHVISGHYTEALIGGLYRDLGYRAAILPDPGGYVRHIGQGRSLPYDGLTDRGA
jgi:hypothetical protein